MNSGYNKKLVKSPGEGNIDAILTRNTKDFKNSELGVMTPENYLKTRITIYLYKNNPPQYRQMGKIRIKP